MMNPLSWNRRGFALQHPLVMFIVGFFAVGFLGAVYVIVLAALYSSTTDSTAQTVINNTLVLFSNFTNQFGTIGTVGGVLVLLVLLAAAGIGAAVAYRSYR
jgi:hypothetical protein